MNNQWFSKLAIWVVIALVLFAVFQRLDKGATTGNQLAYSDFLDQVQAGKIRSAKIQEGTTIEIEAEPKDGGKSQRVNAPFADGRGLYADLRNAGVKFDVKPREEQSVLLSMLISYGPMLLLIGVWIYFMRQMQGGGKGGAFSFGKSKARMLDEANNSITFADVAGCDEAKEEVKELVDFLRDP